MNTHDIELPPLPDLPAYSSEVFDREVKVVSETMAEQLMQAYARAAIAPYAQRIRELESQLEAIGAGGVSSQRVTSQRGGEPVGAPSDVGSPGTLEMCLNPRPVSGGNPVYLYRRRGMGMTYFSSTTKEQYDAYLERPDLVETITLYTAPQPAEPLKPSTPFDDPRVQTVYEIICGDNHPPAGEHWDGYVSRLIVDALFPGESVNSLSDAEIREVLLANGFTIKPGHNDLKQYVYDGARAVLARYGHPAEPEGWHLVPKVPTHEMIVAFAEQWYCHRQSIDDPQMDDAYQAMLAAAPKFGEEE